MKKNVSENSLLQDYLCQKNEEIDIFLKRGGKFVFLCLDWRKSLDTNARCTWTPNQNILNGAFAKTDEE